MWAPVQLRCRSRDIQGMGARAFSAGFCDPNTHTTQLLAVDLLIETTLLESFLGFECAFRCQIRCALPIGTPGVATNVCIVSEYSVSLSAIHWDDVKRILLFCLPLC